MYSGGHASRQAQRAFDEIAIRDVLVWNRLLGIYIKHKQCEEALACAEAMRIEGISPDATTFVLSLKACGDVGSAPKGRELHAEVLRNGLLRRDLGVGNSLIHMYVKLGSLRAAIRVFDLLPARDAASWNTIISGFSAHGHGGLAIECFDRMHGEGIFPNAVSFVCASKACCIGTGGMIKCRELHARIELSRLIEREIDVGNALIRMYAEKGRMAEAGAVFERLSAPDVVSWNSLIGGYGELGQGDEVLRCLKEMRVPPDAVTYVYGLKACAEMGAIAEGHDLHAEIERKGLIASNCIVGNALVDMYAKCGLVVKAREAFDMLPVRDAIAWNALISGYVELGDGKAALMCYDEMLHEGVVADGVTIVCGLRACGIEEDLDKGIEIHVEMERKGSIGIGIGGRSDLTVTNALMDMYLRCCGTLARGRELFDAMPGRDIVSWNVVVAGCVRHGYGGDALAHWTRMRVEGIHVDGATTVSALRACAMLGDLGKGKEIHCEIEMKAEEGSSTGRNRIVACALIDMYAKCGSSTSAREVLDKLAIRDAACWNALIAGYAELGESEEAVRCLGEMRLEGALPDSVALACALKACARTVAIGSCRGREMQSHLMTMTEVAEAGNRFVGAALIDLYAKAGSTARAQQALEKLLPEGDDVVLWNALIDGLVRRGSYREALGCFDQMKVRGVSADAVTYLAGLRACRGAGCLERGLGMHAEIAGKGLSSMPALGNALVDMYSRCGCLMSASRVFDRLLAKDVVSWNALMSGYSRADDDTSLLFSFAVFDDMIASHVEPDPITFVVLLNACSRALLAQRAQACFESMSHGFLLRPDLEHYACFVDLLSRSGELAGALQTALRLPGPRSLPIWRTLLCGCERSGNARIASDAFAQALLANSGRAP